MFNIDNAKSAFISYGEQVKMYTLHVIYQETRQVRGIERKVNRSAYIKNLANDKDRAIQKAVEYAAEHGIEFVSTENANRELSEIKRRNSEDLRRMAEEREAEAQRKIEETADAMVILFEEQFQSDSFAFGKHQGEKFSDVLATDPQYVKYILGNSTVELPVQYPSNLNQACVNSLYAYVQEVGYPKNPEDDSEYVGTLGDKLEVTVTVKKKVTFDTDFGTKTMYKFMDENNNVIITFYSGHSWSLDVGDTANIKGTVDKHQVYDNVNQTLLKRVKAK